MKKKLFMIGSIILSISIITGCSGDKNNENDDVEISFLYQADEVLPESFWGETIDSFEEENPGITVNGEAYPDPKSKEDFIKTRHATDQMPDVVFGGIEDLKVREETFKEIPEDVLSKFDENVITAVTHNGIINSLPASNLMHLNTFYNKDIFNKYDLSTPNNWNEFTEILKTLKDNDVPPIVGTEGNLSGRLMFTPMMTAWLNEMDEDFSAKLISGEKKFNGPEITKIGNEYKKLVDEGYFMEGSLSYNGSKTMSEFTEGNAAIIVEGQFNALPLVEDSDFEVGWFPLPGENSAETYPILLGDEAAVSYDTEYPEESFKLVEYLFSDDIYAEIVESKSSLSTLEEDVNYDQSYLVKDMTEQSENLDGLIAFNKELDWPNGLNSMLQDATGNIRQGADVDGELDKLENKFRELVE